MKRLRWYLFFFGGILGCLSGNVGFSAENSAQNEQRINAVKFKNPEWKESDVGAIAFLGEHENSEQAAKVAFKIYGLHGRSVELDGNEWYLIIPRNEKVMIQINRFHYDVTKNREILGEAVYSAKEAPVLLRCNLSDISANSQVSMILGERKVAFHPRLSLKDSTIELPKKFKDQSGTVVDLSQYEKLSAKSSDVVFNEQNIVSAQKDYSVKLKDGKVSLVIDRKKAKEIYDSLGKKLDPQSFNEPMMVEGLSGKCQKIFVGDIGQDIHPILCMLMEDGRVEMLGIYNAIRYYDFLSSGPLPKMQDIVSFAKKEVIDRDENGDPIGGYVTIFAKDSAGKEYEVFPFVDSFEKFHFEKTKRGLMRYTLRLSSDWKMEFTRRLENGDMNEEIYIGRFRGVDFIDYGKKGIFTYETVSALLEDVQSETGKALKNIKLQGSFSIQKPAEENEFFKIKAVSGKIKFSSSNNSDYKDS